MEVKIPDLGDIEEVEVIEICVAIGDVVEENDTLIVIESDKASMDVPAGAAGTVEAITVALGDMVSEGSVIAQLNAGAAEASSQDGSAAEEPEQAMQDAGSVPEPEVAETPKAATGGGQTLDILVPDIGEATGVVVIEIAVSAGQTVAENDLLVVLESDKASMEIAAEHSGEILDVLVNVDDEVEQGTIIARIRTEGGAGTTEPEVESPAVKPAEPAPPEKETSTPTPAPPTSAAKEVTPTESGAHVYAGPATRRLARELGVDLAEVSGTGQRGRILKDDVKAFVKSRMTQPGSGGGAGLPAVPEVDFAKFGEIELVPLSRIRQRGADNLHRSWVNLPHVTQHDEADITDMEELRQSLKQEAEARGIKLTPLAFIMRAVTRLLSEHPEFNSSLAASGDQLVLKRYINVGMAVDTPEGLVVPVIKAADTLDVWALSERIAELSAKARDKKLALDDLSGATFTISSLGALGGTGFTPIVNAPEVAILGVARLATKPLWNGSEFLPRKVLPLSLSYDHRVINGADGGRFMFGLKTYLEDFRRLAL